jgi:Family of unknown function (DUF6510)
MLGEHHAYRGAGIVLRCPTCHEAAIVVVERERQLLVEWRGTYAVQR